MNGCGPASLEVNALPWCMLIPRRRDHEAEDPEPVELAALADGSLEPGRRAVLEAEVAASPELAGLLAEQQRAVALTRSAAETIGAPASLRAQLERERRAPRTRAPRLRFPRVAVAGAAAAAALGAAVIVLVVGSGTSAQQFHAALAGTDLAPAATGSATLTKTTSGWRIAFDAAGLPRLDSGRFYEAWLKNADGVLVPIGTFNEGRKVTLWAGVSPQDFTTLSVTRERADGNQDSSGEKVLVGTVETGG
jgi:anti-sigma-K factor RskA